MNSDETRDIVNQAVAELRRLPYSKLRRRVKTDPPWDAGGAPNQKAESGETAYVFIGAPTVRWRTGPSGGKYRLCVLVSWANRDRDLEVLVWIDDPGDALARKPKVIERFEVPRVRRRGGTVME